MQSYRLKRMSPPRSIWRGPIEASQGKAGLARGFGSNSRTTPAVVPDTAPDSFSLTLAQPNDRRTLDGCASCTSFTMGYATP